ncbi:MAG: hypothetical protein NBV63_03255 [Candidatus Pacebacteria bacterium]|nr:hypothetical protein [Candidatus Paceibacterota bacterium]
MNPEKQPGEIDPQASNPHNQAVFEDLLERSFPEMSPAARALLARSLVLAMFGIGVSSPIWYHQIIAALLP